MTKFIEATGKTREEAVASALSELGLTEEEVSVEIITMPKSGFLGIGAVPAKVRVSYEAKDEPKKAVKEKKVKEAQPKQKAAKPVSRNLPEKDGTPVEITAGSREEKIQSYLEGLLKLIEVDCTISMTKREDGTIDVKLDGPSIGAVIGRRGETLDAIQHLVNYSINRGSEKHGHINIDAEDYRCKREDSLIHLAEKMAAKVMKYKRSMALEPMNSYERHVIHTALQDYEGVTTSSTGSEPNRRVVINYDRKGAEKQVEAKAVVKEEKPADYPADYEPPVKNKPASREWC